MNRGQGMRQGQMGKPQARKGTIKKLIKFVVEKHLWRLIIVISAMIIATFMNVKAMTIIQNIVEEAQLVLEKGDGDFTNVIKALTKMGIFYFVGIIFTYVHLRIMIVVGQESLLRMRDRLFTHMTTLPIKFFDQNQHGDLMSVFTNDVNSTRQMISQSLPEFVIAILTIFFYLVQMFFTSYILSILMVMVALIFLMFSKHMTSSTRPFFMKQQQALGKLNGFVEEMVEGQKVVKIFRREEKVVEDFNVLNEDLTDHAIRAGKRMRTLIPFTVSVGYLAYVIIAIVGSSLVSIGHITLPALILFLVLTRSFIGPFNRLSNQMSFIAQAVAGADRVFKVMEEESEVDEGNYKLTYASLVDGVLVKETEPTDILAWYNDEDETLIRLWGDIKFKNVTFGYTETPVLKDVSLYAKPGQKIAFVGATGAGKTTVANLINRFYDINEGVITFDGINILDIKKDYLRQAIAVVLQDTSLFSKTVKENIRYGNLNATDEEVYEASKTANAHEFILKLPQGYDTVLENNGENLSQGQRQLLSIARAIVADRPVLILDEATSSVDTHTEKLIQDAMDKLMTGRTVFVIAHRLSTIQNSNAIIVLEQGEIIERGDHDFLLDTRGKYYELYTGTLEFE